MQRLLVLLVFALGFAALPAGAQVSTKAYAPENLSQLAPQDRARVISLEYEDQSNGRRIPEDQLEFYMDQVRSGWTFSRIKQDIATSLGGGGNNNGGWNGGNNGNSGNNGNWNGGGQAVRCDSVNERPRQCTTNFRNRAVINRTFSRNECVEGRTWGQSPGMVWVNRGCRAEFVESRSGWEGNNGYSVTCASPSEAYRTCSWNNRYGRPVLIETLSRTQCVEGRTWGYRGNAIWVDRGCRGRFGVR